MNGTHQQGPTPYTFTDNGEARQSAPHVARNVGPIIEVLKGVLPGNGLVLEVASGTGEHALAFARAFPHLLFQPTDADPVALRSVEAWRTAEGAPNLLAPVPLNASADQWPLERADAILCINMIHISPWEAALGLLKGAGRLLPSEGVLYLYGPYRQRDVVTAASNEAFDHSLKERNPAWGLRNLEDVTDAAKAEGLRLESVTAMPANNLSVVFLRS